MDSDVLFLDIQLGKTNGNDIAVCLRKKGYQGILVQCSGVYMPTPETIKISPYRYIVKQAERNELYKNISEIFEEMDRLKTCFTMEVLYKREKIVILTSDTRMQTCLFRRTSRNYRKCYILLVLRVHIIVTSLI